MLVRKCYLCMADVKVQLFQSYVMNLYDGTLWSRFTTEKLREFKVAYNNVFKTFLGLQRLGISDAFLDHMTSSSRGGCLGHWACAVTTMC